MAGAATASPQVVAGVKLTAGPLGIDVAPWTNPANLTAVRAELKAAGITQIHYGGGTTADEYYYANDTDIGACKPPTAGDYGAKCATHNEDALKFSTFSQDARAIGAQSMVTVNYGTGKPGWAAAWVKQAAATRGQAVTEWEIGNENYGCWEPNQFIAGMTPTSGCVVSPANPDPGTTELATSYATHAATFMKDMKAANKNAELVVPWAFDGTVSGASVADNTEWNDEVLGADARYISAVDVHWYPYGFVGNTGVGKNPSAQQVIQSVEQIPSEYGKANGIQATLSKYDPGARFTVGETGVSYQDTNIPCTPAGALFAAGDALEWLSVGAQSVQWWPLATASNIKYTAADCKPDEAMFTDPLKGTPQPLSPYTGYLLAAQLAQPNAHLSALTTSNPAGVLGFKSVLPDGQTVVALINTITSSAERVTAGTSLTGELSEETYSAHNQNQANTKIVSGRIAASSVNGGITLPPESIVVLKTLKPSAVSLAATGASYKAGTRVTLRGKLSLSGGNAPAGDTLRITRVRAGSRADGATLTARTGAGGTFTLTNVPPTTGTYVYDAIYSSGGYAPSSHSVAVRITAAKPALRLAVSARSVRAGRNVTVTATLGAPHANRRLAIYAQPKGSARKLIKWATINRRNQLSVVYTVRANTTFTVTFSGDSWYTSGSATASVTS